ncbi:MAG: trypsin-like peptidase domain-containing protein, partial [Nitrospinaceae bacterium]
MPRLFRQTIALFLLLAGLVPSVPVAAAGDAANRRTPLVRAVERAGPAVVNIFTTEAARKRQNPFGGLGDDFFERFFQDFFPPTTSQRRSLGSGVIINPEGYVLTNEHVVRKATSIKVTLIGKREFDGHLVGADIKSDLAIIKIESKQPLPYIEMGRSDDLMIGETVLAIGNPFGLQHTVTTGIISALNRSIRGGREQVYQDFIQVDASINPGNSGGPLLNINGSLIGINTAIYQKAEGIGFAIPIDAAKRIVNDLISYGKVRRGWTGLSVQDMSPDLREHFKVSQPTGVLVIKVVPGSPAARAGIQRGDVLLGMDKHDIENRSQFRQRLSTYSVGNAISFTVSRDGRESVRRVKVSALTRTEAARFARDWLGLGVTGITRTLIEKHRLHTRKGVMVSEVV